LSIHIFFLFLLLLLHSYPIANINMKAIILYCIIISSILSSTAAFISRPSLTSKASTLSNESILQMFSVNDDTCRRTFFLQYSIPLATLLLSGKEATASSLLEDFGTDFSNFEVKKAEVEKPITKVTGNKGANGIDPTLKGSYYYPTAKKRYVPRIMKVSNSLASIPDMIDSSDWDAVSLFANKVADDAILPMKLYQSSLDGQGLNMKNDYVTKMKDKATLYEEKTRDLQKAAKTQNKEKAFVALNGMAEAITEYRVAGRISDDDGNIPTVEDMRRSGMRRPVTSTLARK